MKRFKLLLPFHSGKIFIYILCLELFPEK